MGSPFKFISSMTNDMYFVDESNINIVKMQFGNQTDIDTNMKKYLNTNLDNERQKVSEIIKIMEDNNGNSPLIGHAMVLKSVFSYHDKQYALIKNSEGPEYGINGHIILSLTSIPEYKIYTIVPLTRDNVSMPSFDNVKVPIETTHGYWLRSSSKNSNKQVVVGVGKQLNNLKNIVTRQNNNKPFPGGKTKKPLRKKLRTKKRKTKRLRRKSKSRRR
jgi:hypothetical protein